MFINNNKNNNKINNNKNNNIKINNNFGKEQNKGIYNPKIFFFLGIISLFAIVVRSDDTVTITYNGYLIEYGVKCNNETINFIDSKIACINTFGPDSTPATIPSSAANDAIKSLIKSTSNAWLGGSVMYNMGYHFFWPATPRNDSIIYFSDLSACSSGVYCNFVNKMPGPRLCGPVYAYYVMMYPNGSWINAPSQFDTNCPSASCAACHRFPCLQSDINISCVKANTVNVSGYFPNCKCICKTGYGGRKCEGRAVNNGNYTSIYTVNCSDTSITYSEAQAACRAQKDGWDLGTIPSSNASDVVKALTIKNMTWLAGSDVGKAGEWKWMTGRQAGKQFSQGSTPVSGMYTNWDTGRPRPSGSCGTQKRNYLVVDVKGKWSDQYNSTSCDTLPQCYLCEQSPCMFGNDCDAKHSTGIVGNYGDCNCICQDGWGGKRCNVSSILYTPKYSVEYKVQLNSAPLTFTEALLKCKDLGSSWTIASAHTKVINDKIGSLIWENSWIGGIFLFDQVIRKNVFEWDYGRGKRIWFADETKCVNDVYCNFANGGPYYNPCHQRQNNYLIMLKNATWLDISSTTYPDCNPTSSYVCERSPCNITADCFSFGTSTTAGFFPNCVCNCKNGFSGLKCDSYFFNVSNESHSLVYSLSCSASVSFTEAQSKCRAMGLGWDLGTVPLAQVKSKLNDVTSTSNVTVWLAGSDVDKAGEWKWVTGKQAGKQFSQGSTPVSGMYTNWGTGRPRPSDTCGTQKRNYLVATSDGTWSDMFNDTTNTSCDNLPECYLCEKTSCVFEEDCDTAHSFNVTGAPGMCFCWCKLGWGGPRCNISAVLYTANYAVEYYVTCGFSPVNSLSAIYKCVNMGEGWALATSYSLEINKMISSLTIAPTLLYGIRYDNFSWPYGRAQGVEFADPNGCISSGKVFCNFIPGRPKYVFCDGYNDDLVILTNGSWLDINGYSVHPNCNPTLCYACERSPCNLTYDCFELGSLSVSGYYPSCKCVCKGGFSGPSCNTSTAANGYFKSEFVVICKNNADSVTFADARVLCKNNGKEWLLATLAGANANSAIKLFGNNFTWLGGSSNGFSGSWTWLEGRLKGKVFYKEGEPGGKNYTNWATGRPKDETCGTEKREYLTLNSDGTWVDSYGVSTTCAGAPKLPKCYACERQPCDVNLDCNRTNTQNSTGYFPNCTCNCKGGWGGSRCDLNVTIDNGGYLSEYKVNCWKVPISFNSAFRSCYEMGPDWSPASVPTKAANDFIANQTTERIWIGASFDSLRKFEGYQNDQWYWVSKVRAVNHFATPSACLSGAYCNFKPGESLSQSCLGSTDSKLVINGTDSGSIRYWQPHDETSACGNMVNCVACERSLCTLKLDCNNSANLEQVVGYYPNCKCICKWGYGGDGCSIPSLVNVGNYSSSFDVWCENTSKRVLSFSDAQLKCKNLGFGFALATVPNEAAHDLLSEFAKTNEVWLDGYDASNNGNWRWQSGRMNGVTFYGNSSCASGSVCYWDVDEPSNKSNYCLYAAKAVYKNSLSLSKGIGIRKWRAKDEDAQCDPNLPRCYACERSLCVLSLDCNTSNSVNVTGYFNDCQCKCVAGYGGQRCDSRVCTNEADCHGRATNVTGVYPNCTCTGCPPGYDTPDCSPGNGTTSVPVTTVDPNRRCPFNVTSCGKDEASDVTVLNPMYMPNISLNGLASEGKKGVVLLLPMPFVVIKYNFTYELTIVDSTGGKEVQLIASNTSVVNNAIVVTIVASVDLVEEQSPLYLHLISATNLIEKCCSLNSSSDSSRSYFYAGSANDTFRIGELALLPYVPTPESDNSSTYSIESGQDAEKKLIQQAAGGNIVADYTELFGSHSDHVVMRSLSPFALIVTVNDDGYSGVILSNLIFIAVVTLIHFIVVIIQKYRQDCTIHEACAIVSFPSMPIYVMYALLPGMAVATGELLAKTKGMGILGLVIILAVVIGSGLVPFLWLSRALYTVPLLPDSIRSRVELLFPSTFIAPFGVGSMFKAMIGNIRISPMSLWPTMPVWSSVLLFIAALIQPKTQSACIVLYVVLGILHFLLILFVIIIRPLSSLSLNAFFAVGLMPTILLSGALASTTGTDSYSTGTASRVCLILFTIVNVSRLAIAVSSPFQVFQLFEYFDTTSNIPLWSYSSCCGKSLVDPDSLNDLNAPLYSLQEVYDVEKDASLHDIGHSVDFSERNQENSSLQSS